MVCDVYLISFDIWVWCKQDRTLFIGAGRWSFQWGRSVPVNFFRCQPEKKAVLVCLKVLHWSSTGPPPALHRHSTGAPPALHRHSTGPSQALHRPSTDTLLALHQPSTSPPPHLHWPSNGPPTLTLTHPPSNPNPNPDPK